MPKRVIMPPVERLKIKKRSLLPQSDVETQTCACMMFRVSRSHPTNCGNCAHDQRYHTANSIGNNTGRCTAQYLVRRSGPRSGAYDPSDTLLGGQGGGVYYEEMPPDETEIESEIHD